MPDETPTCGLTSIVVLTHDALAYTRQCVDSLRARTRAPYQLVVVDNGSTDGTVDYLRGLGDAVVVENAENRGFPAAANQGLRAASGDQLLLLNNDVVVTDGWLTRLLRALHADPAVGLVGPCSNCVSGPQQVSVSYDGLDGLDAFADDRARRHAGRTMDLDRLVGFCLLMRRAVVDRVGLLDEGFGTGTFEDDDFCLRARAAGFRTVVALDAFVHHFGSRTFVASGIDMGSLLAANERRFRARWGPVGEEAPLLSLCMIARDNEATIEAALASARPWVDEMVVVDTGSTDRTPAIARALGARVSTFAWCDDFAAARNASLAHAAGRWCFWMDTDDVLPPEAGQALRARLERPVPPGVLGLVVPVHCPGAGADATVVDHVKVVRRRPDVRFEGRIHEQVLPSIRRAGGDVERVDAYVVHAGADRSPEGRRRKLDRDLRLLRLDLAERPGHPFVLFNLGMTLVSRGDHADAVDVLERCLEASHFGESHLRKAYALLVEALAGLGDRDGAQRRCWEGLGRLPDDVELRFKAGGLALAREAWAEAADAYERLLAAPPPRYFASLDRDLRGYKAHLNLALAYEGMGRPGDAETAWRSALDAAPDCRAAWDGLADCLLRQGRFDVLAREVDARRGVAALAAAVGVAGARLLACRGRRAEAAAAFAVLLARFPADAPLHREYARFLFERGTVEAAEPSLRALVRLAPDDPAAHHNLGQVLLHRGRPAAAAEVFRRSLALRPGHAPTLALLARAEAAAPAAAVLAPP